MADEMRGSESSVKHAGLASWVLNWIRGFARDGLGKLQRGRGQRRMELVETLQLGGKRQLMLVVCDGQRFLVGAGGDAVGSIEAMGARMEDEVGRVLGVESEDARELTARRMQ